MTGKHLVQERTTAQMEIRRSTCLQDTVHKTFPPKTEVQCPFTGYYQEQSIYTQILGSAPLTRELRFEEIKIPIGKIIIHTGDLDNNFVYQEFDFMIGKFYDGISDTLWKKNQLKEFYCRRMPDADSYMEMIKENRIDAFMGNQYALYPSGTGKRQRFIDYLNHHISLLSSGSHMAIGFCLDALKIKINDILVTIKEPDQSFFTTQIINERGDIKIDLGNGAMGVFSQQDAEAYLRNKYKLLLISISVSLYSKDGIIGYIARTDS